MSEDKNAVMEQTKNRDSIYIQVKKESQELKVPAIKAKVDELLDLALEPDATPAVKERASVWAKVLLDRTRAIRIR